MKNFKYILLSVIMLTACAGSKTIDTNRLKIGMTRSEVEKTFGKPDRVLHAKIEDRQLLETLEYTDKHAAKYKLTFENHKLIEYKLSDKKGSHIHHTAPRKQ